MITEKNPQTTSAELVERKRKVTALPKGSRALGIVATPVTFRRVARRLAIGFVVLAMALGFVPWRQTVIGRGEVIVWNPSDRPQTIEATLTARLVDWSVQEGDIVREGQTLARLTDTDAKFLDPELANRLKGQAENLRRGRDFSKARAERLRNQLKELGESQTNALKTAAARVEQSKARRTTADQGLAAARKAYDIARKVAVNAAKERVGQAKDAILQAAQAVRAAEQDLVTARLQADRVAQLYAEGIRSKRDDELQRNAVVQAQTALERARLALSVARARAQRRRARAGPCRPRGPAGAERARERPGLARHRR